MDEAIAHGIKSTAGVVTSAAVVMVAVFSIFATLSMLFFKQFGVGLAAAILIDATIVRGVLLPATMKLLGERNWYLPRGSSGFPGSSRASEPAPELPGGPVRLDPIGSRSASAGRDPISERNLAMHASASNDMKGAGGEPKRAFTTARIVALVVIGLVVLALGYVHVSSGDDAVSVPSGAKAGDLILDDCHYGTEHGNYAADCGTLVVPENRHKADSRLIAVPVTRIRARSADPAEPIFRLQGGPGSRTWRSRWRADSPTRTTSCWSATAASTARRGSTAPR